MDEFERELKIGFLEEATQMLGDAEQCFLALETSPNDNSILEKIFRVAHNLKGSAKAVGFMQVGEFAHQFESYLLKLKDKKIAVTKGSAGLLLRCNDYLTNSIQTLKGDLEATIDNGPLLAEIQAHLSGEQPLPLSLDVLAKHQIPAAGQFSPEVEKKGMIEEQEMEPETVSSVTPQWEAPSLSLPLLPSKEDSFDVTEITPKRLPDLLASEIGAHIDQLVPFPPQEVRTPQAIQAPLEKPVSSAPQPVVDESIRVSLKRLDKLIDFVGELSILQTVLREQTQSIDSIFIRKTIQQLSKITKEIQDMSMGLRMVSLKKTFLKMQRIVRDTSLSLNKKIHLNLVGEETEVDKTILEALSDPLVHLIRNAVDHGIESPETRLNTNKPETGTITLSASQRSESLIIEISDDGGGINGERLRAKAIEKKMIKPDTVLSEKETFALIFQSGFSTKTEVTDISGRGVGMDVVKTNIEALQGEIQLTSVLHQGTTFRIRLPLTLAIIDGMIIRCGNHRFVIPMSHIFESVRPHENDLFQSTEFGEVFTLRGEKIPLYRLNQLLNLKSNSTNSPVEGILIVVRSRENSFAVLVDEILGMQPVVIKKLGIEHQGLKGFGGSAILGDGKPALILELIELMSRHGKFQTTPSRGVAA